MADGLQYVLGAPINAPPFLNLKNLYSIKQREKMLQCYLNDIFETRASPDYVMSTAILTLGYSSEEIAEIFNEAVFEAARRNTIYVTVKDMDIAIMKVVGGSRFWNQSLSLIEKSVAAYHEAGHAVVGWLTEHSEALVKVTIDPEPHKKHSYCQFNYTEGKVYNQAQIFAFCCVALGGRVAESLMFHYATDGARSDLDTVRWLAHTQARIMNTVKKDEKTTRLYQRRITAQAYYQTEKLLKENTPMLHKVARKLLTIGTLNFEQVRELLGPPPFSRHHQADHI